MIFVLKIGGENKGNPIPYKYNIIKMNLMGFIRDKSFLEVLKWIKFVLNVLEDLIKFKFQEESNDNITPLNNKNI